MNLPVYLSGMAYPLPQALALAGVSLLCLGLRRYRIAAAFVLLGALWLALCATPAFAGWLQRGLERANPPRGAASYPRADAIVVLGGGEVPSFGNGWDDDLARVQSTRTGFALELYRAGRAPVMLLSGSEREASQMAQRLLQQGVPSTALLTENLSMTTYQNALYSAPILRQHQLQRILLVTSAMHIPRATATFRRQGFTVIPAPAADPTAPAQTGSAWLPQHGALRQSGRCLREYIGLWVYRLRGWA